MERRYTLLWYSQTGQSYVLAKAAQDAIRRNGATASLVPLTQAADRDFRDAALVFFLPVHMFQLPLAVQRRLDLLPVLEQEVPAYLVLSFAGWAANTAWMFARSLKAKNIRLDGHLQVKCRDTYIPLVKWLFFLNRKHLPNQKSLARVERFVERTVLAGKRLPTPKFHALDPWHWAGLVTPNKMPRLVLGPRFHRRGRCTGCGLCQSLCPSRAISGAGQDLVYDPALCIGCCGCLNVCPQDAWRTLLYSRRYFFNGLSVPDMAGEIRKPGG